MTIFKKKDDHAGSGIDKPEPKSIVEKLADTLRSVTTPKPAPPAKTPVAP